MPSEFPKILYLAASAYSGTTLLSLLLDSHPDCCTVGHTVGWRYGPDERFACSCGQALEECPFFRHVAARFAEQRVSFDFRNFGTDYRLSENERVNRVLTGNLPGLRSSALERARDRFVRLVPDWRRRLDGQDRANEIFIRAALDWKSARIYVDNSQNPHRLRHLRRLNPYRLQALHLLRDPRGVALSDRKSHNWPIVLGVRTWLKHQGAIARLIGETDGWHQLTYEDLCDDPTRALGELHRFLGVTPQAVAGEIRPQAHHVLGNTMRLAPSAIAKDQRWRDELSRSEIAEANRELARWLARVPIARPGARILRPAVERYLELGT